MNRRHIYDKLNRKENWFSFIKNSVLVLSEYESTRKNAIGLKIFFVIFLNYLLKIE